MEDDVDFTFKNHGSIWLCTPNNADALRHLTQHTEDGARWHGDSLAVEPRYVENLGMHLEAVGFTLA